MVTRFQPSQVVGLGISAINSSTQELGITIQKVVVFLGISSTSRAFLVGNNHHNPHRVFCKTWNELKSKDSGASPANARSPRLFDTVAWVIFRSGGPYVTGHWAHQSLGCFWKIGYGKTRFKGILAAPTKATPPRNKGLIRPY